MRPSFAAPLAAAALALAAPAGASAFGTGHPYPYPVAYYPPLPVPYGSGFYTASYVPGAFYYDAWYDSRTYFFPGYAPPGTSVYFPPVYYPGFSGYPAYLTDGFGLDYRAGYYAGPGWASHPSHAPSYYWR